MKRTTQWFVIVIAIFSVLFVLFVCTPHPAVGRSISFGSIRIPVEVVDTDASRALGLSGRTSLSHRTGMLFLFPDAQSREFWMKDMHFPLDIIWINQGIVTDIATLPVPTSSGQIPAHASVFDADRVLELNAGEARELGITLGASIDGLY
jgi:hypothetical protein